MRDEGFSAHNSQTKDDCTKHDRSRYIWEMIQQYSDRQPLGQDLMTQTLFWPSYACETLFFAPDSSWMNHLHGNCVTTLDTIKVLVDWGSDWSESLSTTTKRGENKVIVDGCSRRTKERWRQVCPVNRNSTSELGEKFQTKSPGILEHPPHSEANPQKRFGHWRMRKRQTSGHRTQVTGVSHLQDTNALKTFPTENSGMLRHPR